MMFFKRFINGLCLSLFLLTLLSLNNAANAVPSLTDNTVTITAVIDHEALLEMHQVELKWGKTPKQQLQESIDIANRVLVNSDITEFSYQLTEVIYLNRWSSLRQLDGYVSGEPEYTNINIAMAIARGNADRVLFVTPHQYMRGAGGWASMWKFENHDENKGTTLWQMRNRYIQVLASELPDTKVAHELGHTLGLAHERGNEGYGAGTGFVDYARPYGYTSPNHVKTVMSYGVDCPDQACDAELEQFSSPDLYYQDEAMGKSVDNIDAADASGFIKSTWPLTTWPVRDLVNINYTFDNTLNKHKLFWQSIEGYDSFNLYKTPGEGCPSNASHDLYEGAELIASLTSDEQSIYLDTEQGLGCFYLEGVYQYNKATLRRPLAMQSITANLVGIDVGPDLVTVNTAIEFDSYNTAPKFANLIEIPFYLRDESITNEEISLAALQSYEGMRGIGGFVPLELSVFQNAVTYEISGQGKERLLTLHFADSTESYKPLFEHASYSYLEHGILPFQLNTGTEWNDYKGTFYIDFKSLAVQYPQIIPLSSSALFNVNEQGKKTLSAHVTNIVDAEQIKVSIETTDPDPTWFLDDIIVTPIGDGNFRVDVIAEPPPLTEHQYSANISLADYGVSNQLNFMTKTWAYAELDNQEHTVEQSQEFYLTGTVYNQELMVTDEKSLNMDLQLINIETGSLVNSQFYGTGHSFEKLSDHEYRFSLKARITEIGNFKALLKVGIPSPYGGYVSKTIHEFQLEVTPGQDSDSDGIIDVDDAFPHNPDESSDSDGDGMGDNFELANGLDIYDDLDAYQDIDGDGLSNLEEFVNGTNPLNADSDGDGYSDSDEISLGTDPTDSSSIPGGGNTEPEPEPEPSVVSLNYISLIDLNGDQINDFGVFDMKEGSIPTLSRYSGSDEGGLIDRLSWSAIYSKAEVKTISDITGDGVAEIALFGLRNDGANAGKWQAVVNDGVTGTKVKVYNWIANWVDAELMTLSDLTFDSVGELALSGNFATAKRRQLFVRDTLSPGTKVAIYSFPDLWNKPQYIQLADHNKDGVDDIGFFGLSKKTGKAQIRIKSGVNERQNIPAYNFPAKWDEPELQLLGDKNADGVNDLGIFGQSSVDGRWQLFVKKGGTNKGGLGIFSWPDDLTQTQFKEVPDMNDDGVTEYAVFAKRGNKYQLRIKSGNDRAITHGVYNFVVKMDNPEFVVLPDLTGDGLAEFGAFGENMQTGQYELTVMSGNASEKSALRTYQFGSDWINPQLSVVDDVDGDGIDDFGFYAVEIATQQAKFKVYSGAQNALLKEQQL